MSGLQLNTITAAGNAAANTVASALVPKKRTPVQALPLSNLGAGALGTTSLKAAAATAPTTSTTGTATAGTSNISSADFMTLLVGELKNQDPTQPTDPNQYITQLAQVNSLQQLIQINQGIGTLDSSATPAKTTATTGA